jgi:hypothetical protein
MNPEQEQELFTTLGRMEAKMDGFNSTLLVHTANDTVNFDKMEADLEILKLTKAKSEGVAEEAAKHAASAGGRWGAAFGGGISLVAAALSAYFNR